MLSASDGCLYLMRTGAGEDFVITEPAAAERASIGLLTEGFRSHDELASELERRRLSGAGVGKCLAQLDQLGLLERAETEQLLSDNQRERYDRQLIYWADVATNGNSAERLQHRLATSTVVVLGCGGLGSWAASALTCAGLGRLVLIDHDRVGLSNLNRQLLFSEGDVGRLKVEAAADALGAHNSEVDVVPVPRPVTSPGDLAGLIEDAELLIATADWPPYELARWVNRACLEAGVPYLSAGQFPPRVRIGPMVLPGRSPCLECIERQTRRDHPLYAEVATASSPVSTAATLGAMSGTAGSLLAMEALHLLTSGSPPASVGNALILDLRDMRLSAEPVRRDPACPLCGTS